MTNHLVGDYHTALWRHRGRKHLRAWVDCMTDIALRLIQDSPGIPPRFDIAIENGDLAADDGLRTAILLSLFLDRRAEDDDEIDDDDRRGSWQDQYLENPNDKQGSRLWLLKREKETAATLQRARTYAEEALRWLVDDGIARKIETEAEWVARGVLGVTLTVTFVDGGVHRELIYYSMEG